MGGPGLQCVLYLVWVSVGDAAQARGNQRGLSRKVLRSSNVVAILPFYAVLI
jgi:hypothetical protein